MKPRILLLAVLAALCAAPAFSQFTTVSGTVTDPNGLAYAPATIKAQLVLAGSNVTGQPTLTINSSAQCKASGYGSAPCQVPFPGTVGPFAMDSTGSFTVNLPDNTQVTPASTQWLFTVNTAGTPQPVGTGPQTCAATISISGASQVISASFACPVLSTINTVVGNKGGIDAIDTGQHLTGPLGLPNWTVTSNGLSYGASAIQGTSAGINSAFWSSNSFTNAQSSAIVVNTLNGTTDLIGATILSQPTGANFYDCVENTTTIFIRKVVNGVPTTLASIASTGNTHDSLAINNVGSFLVCTKNDVPILNATDSTFTSGNPGIEIVGNVATIINFFGRNLTGTSQAGFGNQCSNTSPVTANANVTSDQNLIACALQPFSLAAAGNTLHVFLAGVYSTPAASTSAITVRVFLCTVSGCGGGTVLPLTTITTSALGTLQATNNPFSEDLYSATLTDLGNVDIFEVHGHLRIGLSASNAAAQAVFSDNNTATVGTILTSAQLFLQTTIAFSNASASNSATARELLVRID